MSKLSSITIALIGLVALIVIPYAAKSWQPVSNGTTAEISPQATRDEALDVYLSRLAWAYECVGPCQKAQVNHLNYRRIDSNGQYSYGCLQFQQETYLRMAKKYGVDPWAGGGIYDCENQWKIAKAMFNDDPEAAANHWYTSIYKRGLGLPNLSS